MFEDELEERLRELPELQLTPQARERILTRCRREQVSITRKASYRRAWRWSLAAAILLLCCLNVAIQRGNDTRIAALMTSPDSQTLARQPAPSVMKLAMARRAMVASLLRETRAF